MRLALSIIGSPFRLPLIAAHFPKLARPFNETPLSIFADGSLILSIRRPDKPRN
jgi:hypothetical protein